MIGDSARSLARRFAELEADAHLPVDAVVAFVDDELDTTARRRTIDHLRNCRACAAEVAAQRQVRGALRAAAGPRLPAGLMANLQSIPQTVPLPEAPDQLAVARDGTVGTVTNRTSG